MDLNDYQEQSHLLSLLGATRMARPRGCGDVVNAMYEGSACSISRARPEKSGGD
jgi:hypothetical protein